jgi:phospholipase C
MTKESARKMLHGARLLLAFVAMMQFSFFGPLVGSAQADDRPTTTPIKHVIIIIGENRTFDHIFATYIPAPGETVNNLLSEGIVTQDGTPGPNYAQAQQYSADISGSPVYELSPTSGKALYSALPAPLNGGPTNVCMNNGICTLSQALASEDGLSRTPLDYYQFMLSGGTGLSGHIPDTRILGVNSTPPYSTFSPGPFQITNSSTFPYDAYANSPVHRFYQMWQQFDCNASYATVTNPSGCKADLFTWTEVTVGSNVNGAAQPSNFSTDYAPGKVTTNEGATSMAFYNMAQGDDAPYTKFLANNYAISDNFHQSVMGGTGANHIMLGFGDAIWFSDENGNALIPPHNVMTFAGGPVDEIENPNPVAGTNNWWTEDGYGGFGNRGNSVGVYGGGSYSNCSDMSQPGVGPIVTYLGSLTPAINPNCEPGHYYLLNNYNPGYFGDGGDAYKNTNAHNTPFTVPGTTQRSIADELLEKNISWKTYFDQWDAYLSDKYQQNYGTVGSKSDQYCNICNPFQYSKQIMTNAAVRTAHLKDTRDLYNDIKNGTLPSVSFVKPSGWADGHPASSKWDLFEGFVKKIVDDVKANPELWNSTAIFITTDEGGGYYDSGYIQPLDFFGDGTRIPLIVVSKYTKPGHISHSYADHVSLLKFIERNWVLSPVTKRSRDNFPNPISTEGNPYVPTNSPAISDLFDLFNF